MTRDGKPKPLELAEAGSSSPPAFSHPKPLKISEAVDITPHRLHVEETRIIPDAPRSIKPLGIADLPTGVIHNSPRERPKSQIDLLIEKAQGIEPTVLPHRLRGRLDTVMGMSITELLDFGNRNLAPLQNTSNAQAKITAEIMCIDAVGWINRAREASCKAPSILDRFAAKPPTYYEAMIQKTRAELLVFVGELEQMKKEFFREITDLHLDAIAMIVCADALVDDFAKSTAHNRGRTLLMAHQTAAVLQITIEQSMIQCAQFVQQIDQLLSVTLPQWKIAFK